MNKLKRFLALFLVLCMTLSVVPFSAFASESTDPAGDTAPVADAPEGENEISEEEASVEEAAAEAAAAAVPVVASEDDGIMTVASVSSKPADGTTTGQPFSSDTGGSNYFRIPAIVTLSDGTLVAAADARWNHTQDAANIDTLVSYSKDNGATWNYTFANYIDDTSGGTNSTDYEAATFIDPALAVKTVDGVDTIYMLVDLFPGQTSYSNCIAVANAGTGYDDNGYLKLRDSASSSSYNYYLKDGKIYDNSTNTDQGYTVDAYFNVSKDGTALGNLFNYDQTGFYVLQTSYLYLTKSTDGGATWSEPQMLNSQVKDSSEKFYGVGPGAGLVTSDGTIMFTCYTYNGGDGFTSTIYSTDNGATWERGANLSSQSSEAALAEANGQVYLFNRYGQCCYTSDYGESWTYLSENAGYATGCQLSAITYSKLIDGKTAILLSAPSSGRSNGKIFVGLVNEDKSISWNYTYSVNSGTYQYSSLTELSDGSIGLLYESGSAAITYTNLAIADIASGAEISESVDSSEDESTDDSESEAPKGSTVEVTLKVGESSETYQDVTGNYASTATIADATIAAMTVSGDHVAASSGYEQATSITSGNSYILGNGTQYLVLNGTSLTYTTDPAQATQWTITSSGNGYTIKSGSYYLYAQYSYHQGYTVSANNSSYTWFWSSSNGFYISRFSTYYLTYSNNAWTMSSRSSSTKTHAYSGSTATDAYDYTDVYFTGVNVGTTTATVGSVTYKITVTPAEKTLSIQPGKSITCPATGSVTLAGSYAGVTVSHNSTDGTLTFTAGETEDTYGPYLIGNTQYTIVVADVPDCVDLGSSPFTSGTGNYSGSTVTKVTISPELSYDLNLNISGTNITWTSLDESIATVDQNGKITGVAVGNTYVTCTVDGVTYAIPVVVLDTVDETKTAAAKGNTDLYIAEITNTHVVYSIDMSTEFLEAQEGEIIYVEYRYGASKSYGFAINFFGAEDEGHALTYMAATNSNGYYYSLYSTNDVTALSAYTAGAINNAKNYWTDAEPQELLEYAIENGYDGTMGWTRGSSNTGTTLYSSLTFRSQKLPTVTKEIVSVGGQDYVEGMTAKEGDVIKFKVTVTQYATTEAITYDNDTLTETLVPLSGSSYSVTDFLADTTLSTNKTYEYEVSYTITESDLDKLITNTVSLSYTYDAPYSDGNFSASADASAKITATTYTATDYVIDFGLPVTFNIAGWGTTDVTGISALYADVSISGNHNDGYTITYTPNTILKGVDTVTMTNDAGAEFTFKVYPATTVYYEEGFLTGFTGTWTSQGSKGSGTQKTQILGGSNTDNYGYDVAYRSDAPDGSNSQASTSTNGSTASFTFTGTGFDLYANCATDTGYVAVQVKDASGNAVKLYMVDTLAKSGDTTATDKQGYPLYSLPIVSEQGLAYGTYTVTLTKVIDGKAVNIDGVRIFGTVQEAAGSASVYYADKEDHPDYYQLRDYVLKALNVDAGTSEDYSTLYDQIYAEVGTETVAAVLKNSAYNGAGAQDLLDNGPKNELFLWPGEALVFTVSTDRVVQIGLKAPNGTPGFSITVGSNVMLSDTLNTSTDMFYDVVGQANAVTDYTIIINNTGSTGILSVTDLKICDDPNATFLPLTQEDIETALGAMGFGRPEEPNKPGKNPFVDVPEGKWYHDPIKWAVEHGITNGYEGTDRFGVGDGCTREQFVTLLWRAEGSPEPTTTENPFSDVVEGKWYYEAILWAVEEGITNGYADSDRFGVGDLCTRGQVVTFLHRYAGEPAPATEENPFTDVAEGKFYYTAVLWAAENGITNGYEGTTEFGPMDICAREQIVTILYRYFN
ncbi:MAG: S-layer homology domain-containing protein [Oscillospiraceae bacterium]|nr:S-layer homology domain-containing protein [Oscillospiraceae bacterium]